MSNQTDISFIKVQKGHRVIKLYVRNFAKMMELSDLFVPAGSRTLFDLNFLQFSLFFQELCEGESHFFLRIRSKLYFIKVQRGHRVIKLYTKND